MGWYSVSTVAASPPGFGTVTTSASPATGTGARAHSAPPQLNACWHACWHTGCLHAPAQARRSCSPPAACNPPARRLRPAAAALHPAPRAADLPILNVEVVQPPPEPPRPPPPPAPRRPADVPHLKEEVVALPAGGPGSGPARMMVYVCLQARWGCHSVLTLLLLGGGQRRPARRVSAVPAAGAQRAPPSPVPTLASLPTPELQPRVDAAADHAYLRRYYLTPPPPLSHHQPSGEGAATANGSTAADGAGASPQPPASYHELQQRFAQLPGWLHYRSTCIEDNLMGQGGWGGLGRRFVGRQGWQVPAPGRPASPPCRPGQTAPLARPPCAGVDIFGTLPATEENMAAVEALCTQARRQLSASSLPGWAAGGFASQRCCSTCLLNPALTLRYPLCHRHPANNR